ncbi:dihydroneopterin aldolase [Rossellomorea vietnamensis]|uniref:7,8-dihydroneopterin aldolase n=2 Tax=Rossellomorea TaxID=2837508 RepID=A0A5D4K6M7_9BACI|nr:MULTISPECIES: dihydroneopterin aldolase [Rossellomorea]TYR72938.1 dihydroneopterin aldolase [Rossellomorea vietnamensis]TYS72682.1 dihydroneopterin aldolase [Rossellomorea aquimaris]
MDKINVKDMEFYGYHGVFPEETKLGQRFRVSLSLEMDLSKAGRSDDIDDSVNYGEVYSLCKEVVEGKPYKLLEALAETLADRILGDFPKVENCTIEVIKPDPPIPGHYRSVSVEITRGR